MSRVRSALACLAGLAVVLLASITLAPAASAAPSQVSVSAAVCAAVDVQAINTILAPIPVANAGVLGSLVQGLPTPAVGSQLVPGTTAAQVKAALGCPAVTTPPAATTTMPAPTTTAAPTTTSSPTTTTAPRPLYETCAQVRAAGAAPLPSTAPGYRLALDSDRDGIACEVVEGSGTFSQVGALPNTTAGVDTGDGSTPLPA